MPTCARRYAVAVCAVVACGCGEAKQKVLAAPADPLVSVGRPVPSQRVTIPRDGTIELVGAGLRLVSLRSPNPRDLCVATVRVGQHLGEYNESCGVSVPGTSYSAVSQNVLVGVAGPGVVRVVLHRSGGHRTTLPLSRHRAFMAVLKLPRGRIWVISESRAGQVSTSRFSLPVRSLAPHHPVRRRGAVFNDEIGENILLLSYAQLVRRFGPPARVRPEGAERCAYYEVVGQRDGWRFCFDASAKMTGASGNNRIPPRGSKQHR